MVTIRDIGMTRCFGYVPLASLDPKGQSGLQPLPTGLVRSQVDTLTKYIVGLEEFLGHLPANLCLLIVVNASNTAELLLKKT